MSLRGVEVRTLMRHEDKRGFLYEIIRRDNLPPGSELGQIYVTVAFTGETKGSHFHERKTEWCCAVRGRGILEMRDPATGDNEMVFLDENAPVAVKIPPRVAHRFRNIGAEPLTLVVYASEPFDPNNADAVPCAFD